MFILLRNCQQISFSCRKNTFHVVYFEKHLLFMSHISLVMNYDIGDGNVVTVDRMTLRPGDLTWRARRRKGLRRQSKSCGRWMVMMGPLMGMAVLLRPWIRVCLQSEQICLLVRFQLMVTMMFSSGLGRNLKWALCGRLWSLIAPFDAYDAACM